MSISDIAMVVGIVLGALMILAACWVWVKKQVFGTGGALLTLAGALLVGMSVWTSVQFSVGGIEGRFEKLQKNVARVSEITQELSQEVATVAQTVQADRAQFIRLTESLAASPTLAPQQLEELSAPLRHEVYRPERFQRFQGSLEEITREIETESGPEQRQTRPPG